MLTSDRNSLALIRLKEELARPLTVLSVVFSDPVSLDECSEHRAFSMADIF
jgi:hypothetical protein